MLVDFSLKLENRPMLANSLLFPSLIALMLGGISSLVGLNHDQAIFFQAGLRELAGQSAYRDYMVPQGPVAGFVLSFFLRILPTGGWSMVWASAVLNLITTIAVWKILEALKLKSESCLLGSVVTAIWFLPVFGCYYNDHLAYTFILWGFYFYLNSSSALKKYFLSTFCFALSYHTKQSVGVFGILALLACECSIFKFRTFLKATTKLLFLYGLNLLCILAYFHGITEIKNYVQYSILCPLAYASSAKSAYKLITFILFPWNLNPFTALIEGGWGRLAFYPLVFCYYLAYRKLFQNKLEPKLRFVLLFGILSTLWCAALLGRYYGQLFFGTGIVLALLSHLQNWNSRRALYVFSVLGLIHLTISRGIFVKSDPYFSTTALYPIRIEPDPVSSATKEIVEYFKDKTGDISVVGTRTFLLSPALGKATLNPSIYYQRLLTIPWPKPQRELWMQQLIGSLENKKVKFVVIDTGWQKGYEKSMSPLMEYISKNYVQSFNSDFLAVLERRT